MTLTTRTTISHHPRLERASSIISSKRVMNFMDVACETDAAQSRRHEAMTSHKQLAAIRVEANNTCEQVI